MLPGVTGDLFDLACVAIAALLAVLAYRTRRRALVLLATVVGVSVISGVLLFGFIAYPLLLGVARKRPGQGLGVAFVLAVIGGTLLLAWRIPIPELLPEDATIRASAVVTSVRVRDHIWSTRRNSGQDVPRPFQAVTFDVPTADHGVLHLADRVDTGSVAGLRVGASVAVVFPAGSPSRARLAGGTREWAHAALLYMLKFTWGIAGAIILVAWLVSGARRRLARRRLTTIGTHALDG